MKNALNEDNLQWKMTTQYWKWNLSKHLLDHTQISNLSFDDQTIFYKSFKGGRSPMEDDIKILKVEYISNHLLDPTQIFNLSLDDQTVLYKSIKWRQPPMYKSSKWR